MAAKRIGALSLIVVVFATLSVWNGPFAQTLPRAVTPENAAVTQWKARASSAQKILEENDEGNCRGAPAAGIIDAFGLSSDALSVALVDFCGRGAYTDSIVAMRLDHGNPVPVRFRDAKGKTIEKEFLRGASAMHSVDVRLVAEKKAIYYLSAVNDSEGKPHNAARTPMSGMQRTRPSTSTCGCQK